MTRFTPLWLQSGSFPASVDRKLLAALWPSARSTGAAVAPGAAGGMAVDAAPGSVAVPVTGGGTVLCVWDAPETTTLDPSPPAGSNRTDLVVIQAYGNDIDGGVQNEFQLQHITGAIGGAAPAVPANAVALAQIAVTGGTATVPAGAITDRRPATLAVPAATPASAPRGWIAQIVGPAATVNAGSGTLITLSNVPVVAGRRYRLSCYAAGGQQTAAATAAYYTLNGPLDVAAPRLIQGPPAAASGFYATGVFPYNCPTTATVSWNISFLTNAGTLSCGANSSYITCEDMGGQ